MLTTHAVGIDLGTTYSCIAYLNEHGEPVTLANHEGELATPSAVLFDGDEVVVGTEALRNAILYPESVVQNSKRFIGSPDKHWTIDGKRYTPVDIATFVLKKLVGAAQEQIGSIEQAVITVPAQFGDAQRQATVEAGHRAGLQRVDIINEPVAAALCYVLGTEGLWFTELADEQRIMVYDLGGGTFDLSMVRYQKNEVSVIAGDGDLQLGGIDWTRVLQHAICDQFEKEFKDDPRSDPASLQFIALEAEQTKRSLSVRPKAALTCQHGRERKTYQVTLEQFESLTKSLVQRTTDITKRMLKNNKMGWAHVDVVLTTGGASRMPMIRRVLKKLSGRTLNTSLSPDQSIAHGATYYAGMLLTNNKFARSILNEDASSRLSQIRQQSVCARGLGILVRDVHRDARVPHYLVTPNTPLPTSSTQHFGTVVPNQQRVHLQIIESGTTPELPPVKLGECVIDKLPPNLPEGSEIAVTICYDEQAMVHVSAKDLISGREARTQIVRQENLVPQLEAEQGDAADADMVAVAVPKKPRLQPPAADRPSPKPKTAPKPKAASKSPAASKPRAATTRMVKPKPAVRPAPNPKPKPVPPPVLAVSSLEDANQPIPLCNGCGEPLDLHGQCPKCGPVAAVPKPPAPKPRAGKRKAAKPKPPRAKKPSPRQQEGADRGATRPIARPAGLGARAAAIPPPPDDDEIIELDDSDIATEPVRKPVARKPRGKKKPPAKGDSRRRDTGEDEFWQLVE